MNIRERIFERTIAKALEPVAEYRSDPSVTEIMINGPNEVYIERRGRIEKTNAVFADEESLVVAARNIAQFTDKRILPTTSRFDARLPDKSRVHVVMPRISRKGLCIAIRKFPRDGWTLEKFADSAIATITPEVREYLQFMVELELNILVSGSTGTGKTSFLNALSGNIPAGQRIIVIEDTAELQMQQEHVLSFETHGADRHGNGAVSIRDLFHSALRLRPDRIVIGECRGGEALDLIQALISGHGGSMSTLHASSATDALHRLETMALMSSVELPLQALRKQVASAIDLVVHLSRHADGTRLVTEISEVCGLVENEYELNRVFEQNPAWSSEKGGPRLRPTGKRSIFSQDMRVGGLSKKVVLTKGLFDTEDQDWNRSDARWRTKEKASE